MQYKKSYDHLNVDAPASHASVSPAPNPAPRPAFTPKTSIIPKVVIVGLLALIAYLVYSLVPKSFAECERFPGSKITMADVDTCKTFYGASFTEANLLTGIRPTPTPEIELSPTPVETNSTIPEINSNTQTTKGGLPLDEPTPTIKPAQPTTKPVPTSTPSSNTGSTPNDWVKHRYPGQNLSFYMPPGWNGSTATRNRDTGITTFTLGGTSVRVSLEPNWNNTENANQKAINYEVAGVSAIKLTNDTHTTVYFERGSVHIFSCHNSVWSTCDTILTSLTFTN